MANLNQNSFNSLLLTTKLNMPRLKANLILRRTLINRLNEGLSRNAGLFLLSAPPGYGKTTLACQWLNSESCRNIWLTLDEMDNDPVRFLTNLLTAFRRIDPKIGQITRGLLELEQLPPLDILITPLINDLADLNERVIVVLDDYYIIQNRYIHDIMQLILDYRPLLLSFVLITYEAPPLVHAAMRVGGEIVEVGVRDLSFSEAETAAFMTSMIGLNLEDELIALFNIITEGQIAGLQLMALAVFGRTPEEITDFLINLSSNRNITDNLVTEILARLPEKMREFIRLTAALDRLCAPLCNAITGRKDSRRLLKFFEQNNFFLLSLDDQSQWYCYHQFFAGSVRSKLSWNERQFIHQKAARWYEAEGYPKDVAEQKMTVKGEIKASRLTEPPLPEGKCGFFTDDRSHFARIFPNTQRIRSNFKEEFPEVLDKTLSAIYLIEPLSTREEELLRLVAAGLSNEAIARKLDISLGTTKWHMHNIFQKLGVNSRTQAAIMAKELNLA